MTAMISAISRSMACVYAPECAGQTFIFPSLRGVRPTGEGLGSCAPGRPGLSTRRSGFVRIDTKAFRAKCGDRSHAVHDGFQHARRAAV